MYKDKTILITGGTGSWGRELTLQLLKKSPRKIIIFSRGEFLQVEMERLFNNPIIKYVIGDVRDPEAVDRVFQNGIDIVFALAALKHVPVCENMPLEAIKTNILGVSNLINAAIKYKVKKFIDVSTDKAVNPINLYGMTKAVGEKLVIQANCLTKDTDFICVRGGNVLGTNGSLVPFVISRIQSENKIIVTDPKMTRFFLTVKEAIFLLLYAADSGLGGEIFVMNMPSFKLMDIIEVLINRYGDKNTKIEYIGAREGEKLHEELISKNELRRTFQVSIDFYVILPELETGRNYYHKIQPRIKLHNGLNSTINLKGKNYLKSLLKSGGFI